MVIIPSRVSMLPRASPRRSLGQPASSGRLDTSLPPSQSAGGRVLPARRPAGLKWNSAPLPRRRLARRGLAGSPRRKAVDAQSPHSRERPRCVSESECGTSRGAPRSPGRLVHRRHEANAKKLSATAPFVCWLVSFKNPGNGRSSV